MFCRALGGNSQTAEEDTDWNSDCNEIWPVYTAPDDGAPNLLEALSEELPEMFREHVLDTFDPAILARVKRKFRAAVTGSGIPRAGTSWETLFWLRDFVVSASQPATRRPQCRLMKRYITYSSEEQPEEDESVAPSAAGASGSDEATGVMIGVDEFEDLAGGGGGAGTAARRRWAATASFLHRSRRRGAASMGMT